MLTRLQKMNPGASADKICAICGDSSDGNHFGAVACRACTAFFRRSINDGRQYICAGQNRCTVTKGHDKCKACRMRKSIAVGMKKTAVQYRRDRLHSSPKTPIIDRMCRSYQILEANRKMKNSKEEPYVVNSAEFERIYLEDIHLQYNFVVSCFPELGGLPQEQMKTFINNFFPNFIIFEIAYRNSQNAPSDFHVLANGDYANFMDQFSFFGNKCYPFSESNKVEIEKNSKNKFPFSYKYVVKNLDDVMRKERVTLFEFLCVCAVILWDTGLDGLSPETVNLAYQIRSKIYEELKTYLESVVHHKEPYLRYTNTLLLIIPLKKCVVKSRNHMEMEKFFAQFSVSDDFFEIFMAGKEVD